MLPAGGMLPANTHCLHGAVRAPARSKLFVGDMHFVTEAFKLFQSSDKNWFVDDHMHALAKRHEL